MNTAAFFHADFEDCECCSCDLLGNFEHIVKSMVRYHTGYIGYNGTPHLYPRYRTVVSRGHGPTGVFRIENAVSCTRHMMYEDVGSGPGPDDGYEYEGSCSSKVFDGEDIEDESTTCADGFFDFDGDVLSDQRQRVTSGTTDPLGETTFANLYTWNDFRRELFEAFHTIDFDASATVNDTLPISQYVYLNDNTGANQAQRLGVKWRRRFRIPTNGGSVKIRWKVYWNPAGGSPELYDEVTWQWDGVVPEGYDPEDESTWPTTPWDELAHATEDSAAGSFTAEEFESICGFDSAPSAPVSGVAIAI